MPKKNVLISFVTEADTDLKAVFALNKVLYKLPDSDLVKFDVFDVIECETVPLNLISNQDKRGEGANV